MSERLIAKEHLPTVTAWQAFSFDAPSAGALPIKMPTADEIEAMHRAARDEGYREGIAAAKDELQRMAGLHAQVAVEANKFETDIAEAVLNLALALAKQMLREALSVKPELVLPVVRDALGALVANLKDNSLHLHSSDVDLVRRHLGDEITRGAWRLVADDTVEAGGCRILAANGSVDATLTKRWSDALAPLGRSDQWLA